MNDDENINKDNWIEKRVKITKCWIYNNIYFMSLVFILIGISIGICTTIKYWVHDQEISMDKSIKIGGMIYKDQPYKILLSVNANPDPNSITTPAPVPEAPPDKIEKQKLKK